MRLWFCLVLGSRGGVGDGGDPCCGFPVAVGGGCGLVSALRMPCRVRSERPKKGYSDVIVLDATSAITRERARGQDYLRRCT